MAPALTKVLKDGHGIHLSSPPSSVRADSNGRAVCSAELEPHMRSMGDGDCQKMWLNLSMYPPLESCLPVSPLDVPPNPLLSPCLQASASQCEVVPLPSPASLLSFLSFNKSLDDSHQVVPILPGVPDMFLGPVSEHNSQEACLLHGCSAAPECGPDGGDVHRSPFTLTSVSPSDSLGKIKFPDYSPFFAAPPSPIQEKADGVDCSLPASVLSCSGKVNFDLQASRAVLEEAVKEQLSRQAVLHSRAWTLQKRLQALLGEHAVLHCNQQLEGLKRHCQLGDVSHDSLDFSYLGMLPPQVCSEPFFESPTASSSFTELRQFSQCSQEVLRSLQEAMDSEATASSSSDDDFEEEERNHGKTKTSHVSSSSSSCETQWLEERAELGSRWSWLQLRLAELEGRIQQLVELHKHIRSSKGGVVLADSQPLTDRQIQQTLLREMAGLSCTASDADTEPCSPTHLLYSIERQSAQLSQIVNSLMPPLFSPLSKQAQNCKVKRTLKSGQRGDGVFMPGSSKRRRLATTSLFKADVSCVCARTRPLVTYQKPRLFTFTTNIPGGPPDSGKSSSTLTSSVLSSSCSCFSSCDCSSASDPSTKKHSSTPHPVLFPSFDNPHFNYLKRALPREEWSQRPLVINASSPTPSHCNRRSSTPLHNSQKYKQHARHRKSRVMGLSPIRMSGSARSQHRRANQRKRKRRCIHRLIEDEADDLCQLSQLEESSDEVLEESYTQVSRKQASRGSVRKRQGESVYNINNIVIPLSLAKVEKLQYKDILTPRWRVVSTQSLMDSGAEKEEDKAEGQVEDLSEETFAQRHLALEQREKLRWSSWGKRKCVRRPTRSGSRLSGGGGGMCTSGEESSVEWSGAQLDTDEQPSSEEWLPETPWEPRVFPLGEDAEHALLCDIVQDIPSVWLESGFASSSSKNSSSQLSPPHSSGATLPSGAHSRTNSPNSS